MRAAIYTERGAARDVLRIVELPDPRPAAGEVRVRLRVSSVNPTDWKVRSVGGPIPAPGQIPNQDGAGEIDAVGEGIDAARLGQRAWVFHAAAGRMNGTAAQHTCVPAGQAVPLPDAISFEQGAALGIPYITAHRCLFADGPIDGQVVLVTGGAGAVGNAAIQLARRAGAQVIATASSDEKARLATEAGAHAVLDYRAADFAAMLRAIAPGGANRVVDVALGANLGADIDVLAPGAIVVAYATDVADPVLPVRRLMTVNAVLRFVLVYGIGPAAIEAAVGDITAALREGALRPLPAHHFPLEEIAAAHEAVERHVVGKVLVDIP